MAQLVITAAAATVGYFSGNLQAAMATYTVLSSAYAVNQIRTEGPRLTDAKIITARYGEPIPYVIASVRVAGQVWWQGEILETATEQSGKGDGPKNTTYTYSSDVLFGLSSNVREALVRIWLNGKLVWTAIPGADQNSLDASEDNYLWSRLTFYSGADNQLPDPAYEAAVGAENAIAFRGRASVFIENLQLGVSGQLPNLTFELANLELQQDILLDAPQAGSTADISANPITPSTQPNVEVGAEYTTLTLVEELTPARLSYQGGKITLSSLPDGRTLIIQAVLQWIDRPAGPIWIAFNFMEYGSGPQRIQFVYRSDHSLQIVKSVFGIPAALHTMAMPDGPAEYKIVWESANSVGIYVAGERVTEADISFGNSPSPGNVLIFNNQLFSLFEPRTLGKLRISNVKMGLTSEYEIPDTTLRQTVERLCLRSGMDSGLYDAQALSQITTPVRSFVIGQVGSTRASLEILRTAFQYDAQIADKLYFVPRAETALLTIPYEDLAAGVGQALSEPLQITHASDIEVPDQVAIRYLNVDADYQEGLEISDRGAGGQSAQQVIELAIGLKPAEAKRVADTIAKDNIFALTSGTISVPIKYSKLQPGDVVEVVDGNGTVHTVRLVRKEESGLMLTFEWRKHDSSAYQSLAVTDEEYTPSSVVQARSDTEMLALDIPLLRDADDVPGWYAAVKPTGTVWAGGQVFVSSNDVDFTSAATVADRGVFGVTTTTLPDWTGGYVMDEVSTVTVNVGLGELSSSTRDVVLGDEATNALLIGDEIVRFVAATLVSTNPNIYTLSRLLRGQRGTEWAMSEHVTGDRVVLLRPAGMRRISTPQTDINALRYVKALTNGLALSSADSEEFTNTGVSQKPLAPVNVRAVRAGVGGAVTVTWNRRSRYAAVLFGTLPLGEATEQYRIRLFSGSVSFRTAYATSEQWEYTTQQQTQDATWLEQSLDIEICQVSATVGEGYAARQTVTVLQGPFTFGSVAGVLENPSIAPETGTTLLVTAGDDRTVYQSTDGGETFSLFGSPIESGEVGLPTPVQRAALGDVVASYSHQTSGIGLYWAAVGDINPVAVPTYYVNDIEDTNPATSGIVPRINSTNVGLYTCSLGTDGSKFYLIGFSISSPSLQPSGSATLWESTDGINYTSVGEMAVDPADPNPGVPGSTDFDRQITNSNPAIPLLRKVDSRWFLLGIEATYYTDESVPRTNWRRCVVTGEPRVQFRGITAAGSSLVAYGGRWSGAGQIGVICSSSDSGATWTVAAPSAPSDQLTMFQQPLLEAHAIHGTTVRVWLNGKIMQCHAPYSFYTLEDAVFTGSGTPNLFYDAVITSTGYVAKAATLTAGGALARPEWLVWTDDGINFSDSEIV